MRIISNRGATGLTFNKDVLKSAPFDSPSQFPLRQKVLRPVLVCFALKGSLNFVIGDGVSYISSERMCNIGFISIKFTKNLISASVSILPVGLLGVFKNKSFVFSFTPAKIAS